MILKSLKIAALSVTALLLVLVLSVNEWSSTEEGELPSKTAVVLHAINNNIINLDIDIEVPDFFNGGDSGTGSGESTFVREDETFTSSDGEEIPLRIYRDTEAEDAPILLYYHGGAFLEGYGSLETHDNVLQELASRTGATVVGVGYRVAPEHVFPKAVEDSYEALRWAEANAEELGGTTDQLVVIGDSAGGNLATVTAHMARDNDGPDIAAQVLYYPLTTFQDVALPSRQMYDSGYYLLSRYVMEKARSEYTPKANMWEDPYTSPLEADQLEGLPPALILTAEYDPLRDEGELYAEQLHEAGVPVQTVRYEGVMHGFVSFYEVMKSGEQGLLQTSQYLQRIVAEEEDLGSEEFLVQVQEPPTGMERVREEAEAYAIAAFLIGQSTLQALPGWE
ncbi:alpha/beta hydrolase [Salsuginibacillus kocurii]|uniref:alpha/beta hydrolase n=1 Tax=Salsuginibacillus kocurii TaxID=427078 RepID=UPI0003733DE1|nr:alpha/beta hydrolase [Salsuginibacillus kocurii]